jgi:uncharacterized membrane protein YgcG
MSKIHYKVVENKAVEPHSFYAIAIATGKLSFEDICEEASDGKNVTPAIMRMCVSEYMKAARRELIRGFRVPLGEDFLTLYPNIRASAKDTTDKEGKTIVATPDKVRVANGLSKIACSVSRQFSAEFARKVEWQRVDEKTGLPVEGDEDITEDADGKKADAPSTGGGTSTGGSSTGGGTSTGGSSTGGGTSTGGGSEVEV